MRGSEPNTLTNLLITWTDDEVVLFVETCVVLVDLSGPVQVFYEPVSFQKLVSASIRSWTTVMENATLSEG